MATVSIASVSSAEIADQRRQTLSRLQREPGFTAALESEAAAQRAAEVSWLQSDAFARWWPQGPPGPTVVFDPDPRGFVSGLSAAAALRSRPSEIRAAPGLHSAFAARRLETLLFGDDRAASEITHMFGGKVQGGDAISLDDIRHEAVVGIFGTNALRLHIPTFPFVYAIASVAATSTRQSQASRTAAASPRRKRAAAPCAAGAQTAILLTENVFTPGAVALEDAIAAGMTAGDFFLLFLQVVYALKFASDRIDLTHYDLHPRNVILRAIGGRLRPEDVAYIPFERGEVFVAAKVVAAFVEMGFAHVTARNSRGRTVAFGFAARGRAELVELGIFRDRSNPMTDVYRLLMSSADIAREVKNAGVTEVAAEFLKYFTSEELPDVLERQRENWFYLPLTKRSRAFNFDDFVGHARRTARKTKWVAARAVTSSLPCGASLVRGGDGFLTATCAFSSTATVGESSRCLYVVPKSMIGFVDVYTTIMSQLRAARDYTTTREVTGDFMSGFTRDTSIFNAALAAARVEAERAVSRIVALGPGDDSDRTIMVLYCALRETQVALRFISTLYWKDAPPDTVDDFSAVYYKMLNTVAAAAAPIARRVKNAALTPPPPALAALCEEATAADPAACDSDSSSSSED